MSGASKYYAVPEVLCMGRKNTVGGALKYITKNETAMLPKVKRSGFGQPAGCYALGQLPLIEENPTLYRRCCGKMDRGSLWRRRYELRYCDGVFLPIAENYEKT